MFQNHQFRLSVHVVFFACVLITVFMGIVSVVNGATTDFTVRTLVGQDTTPPTVPAWITATPVAMTQIDLAWGTSTDDQLLSGYHVYRDDMLIATTTLTSYADTGLTASTTYTYYVTAFDSSFNISASSSLIATTTFATPTPPVTPTTTSTGPIYGSRAKLPELVSLEVIPSQFGARIRFETVSPVRSVLKWGTSVSYELGSSAERSFSRFHEMAITDLTPGTRYRFTLEGETHMGRFGVLTESSFTTLPSDDVTPPGLVTGLVLKREGDDIIVTWQNPGDQDFDHVRVVRSTHFYPDDEADGWVVFEGDGTRARDERVAVPGTRIYYAVFTYDHGGNISAPAVISALIPKDGGTPGPLPPVVDSDPTKNKMELSLDQIELYQEGKRLTPQNSLFAIDGSRHLTIAIPYEKLPEHLKTILVTIIPKRDTDTSFQFLLRINREKTAYTARLAPFGEEGDFHMRVSVFDFKTNQIGYTEGRLASTIGAYGGNTQSEDNDFTRASFMSVLQKFIVEYALILVLAFIIILALSVRALLRHEERTQR